MPSRHTSEFLLPVLLIVFTALGAAQDRMDSLYTFRSGSITASPVAGERTGRSGAGGHLIAQFYQIPAAERMRELRLLGIEPVRYLGGRAYLVKVTGEGGKNLDSLSEVRATLTYKPEMKLSRRFGEDDYFRPAIASDLPIKADILFHDDVDFPTARRLLAGIGIPIEQNEYSFLKIITIEAALPRLREVAALDEVDLIDPAPQEPVTFNADARVRVNVTDIYRKKNFKRVTGQNVKVGIWDSGQIGQHGDFDNRVTNVETGQAVADHTTHVAGTIGGSGAGDKRAQGMADKTLLFSYNFQGDPVGEMSTAAGERGILLTNNSWGNPSGWDYHEEGDDVYYRWLGTGDFGYYNSRALSLDTMIRERDQTSIWAAGNERNDAFLGPHKHYPNTTTDFQDLHPSDPDYGSIPTFGNAKNNIVVGATMKDDAMTYFSSWGPTDDGRLKPDVVATGYLLYSTLPDNQYGTMSGTSMATPVVTGVAALLSDYHQKLFHKRISSQLLKALLIHSARDLGPPGPDYSFGHGIVDAELAAKVLGASAEAAASPTGKQPSFDVVGTIVEGSIDNGKKKRVKFKVPEGAEELRATLVWHDPAGPSLINDLDLWMKTKNVKNALPFTLNPAKPDAPAERKRNSRDNVEYILVENPNAGVWKVFVKGTLVAMGPQNYTLVLSAGRGNAAPQIIDEGKLTMQSVFTSGSSDWNNADEKTTFTSGDEFYAYVYFRVSKNGEYGSGYYGTISGRWIIRNSSGTEIFKLNSASSSFYANQVGSTWRWRIGSPDLPYKIPSMMPGGTYTVEVTLTMNNGYSESASTSFTVQ